MHGVLSWYGVDLKYITEPDKGYMTDAPTSNQVRLVPSLCGYEAVLGLPTDP